MIDRPPLPIGTIAAVAAGGVLLLAFFHLRAGGTVGPVVALLIASSLGVAALVLRRGTPRRAKGTPPSTALRPAATESRPTARSAPPLSAPPYTFDTAPSAASPAMPLGAMAQRVATEIARLAVAQLSAPAASVLVERAGRLIAAGSAGDWGAARRGLKNLAGPGLYDVTQEGGEPPEFRLDPRNDWLPRILALYGRPVPMERWNELSDAPGPLLPLAALAASGVGVAVPLTHGRRLAGVWVVAQRPDAGRYTDDELSTLQRLARDAGRSLADALDR